MRKVLLLLSVSLFAVRGSPPAANSRYHRPAPEITTVDAALDLTQPDQIERLAQTDALAFLRAAIARYRNEVQGFRALLQKQERLNGKLGPIETIDVAFREKPFSVLLKWRGATASLTDRALYVAGQNNGQALARGKLLHIIHSRDPYGTEARAAGRYAIPDFGLAKGSERTLAAWQAALGRGNLKAEYLGQQTIPEAGGVRCFVFRRTCDPPEDDGVASVKVAFDMERWLQVANVLTGPDGQIVGAYYFRDVVLNPDFPPGQFERAALSRDETSPPVKTEVRVFFGPRAR